MASSPTEKNLKLNFVIVALLVSAFGPYVLPTFGVRLEQIVIYGLVALMMIAYLFATGPHRLNRDLLTIAALFGLAILWTCPPTFLGNHDRASVDRVITGIERFARPVATILILALVTRSSDRGVLSHSLRLACLVICLLLAVNSVLCVAQTFSDTWPYVQFFVRPEETRDQSQGLWQVCAELGRYNGIFMQPLENGLAHSIGVMAWIYYASSTRKASLTVWVLLVMVIIGGLMSVSKMFLLGGLPVGIAYMLMSPFARRAMNWKAVLPTVASLVVLQDVFQSWSGASRLLELLGVGDSQLDPLELYSGGRVWQGSGVADLFAEIWEAEPISGFGFGYAYGFPFDNAWLEFFAQGGLVALCLYTLILFLLGRLALHAWQKRKEEGFLLTSLWIIIVGGGLGAPILTLNRSSTLLWVLISLCIVIVRPRRSDIMG